MATDGALTKPLFSVLPFLGRRRFHLWLVCVSAVVSTFLAQIYLPEVRILPEFMASVGAGTLLAVFLIALLSEYIDASLGGGFGTILSPILGSSVFLGLTFGFDNYVPCLLISEFFAGIWAGFMHNRDGNVDLRGDAQVRRTVFCLTIMSVVGVRSAVYVEDAIDARFDPAEASRIVKGVIGAIILLSGTLTLVTLRHRFRYRPAHIIGLGAIATFNKAFSGGGYGPLVTSGQVVSGLSPKQAVACTAMAESMTSFLGAAIYIWFRGDMINWALVPPLVLGSFLSVPLATLTVRRLPETVMRATVGILTILLALNLLGSSVLKLF